MAGVSNSTTLSELVGEIVSRDVQTAAYANRVMRPLVRVHHFPPGAGSMVVPRFKPYAVESLTEGVAPDRFVTETEGETLVPQERGTYTQISKRALFADPFSDLSPYGDQLGRALAEDEDVQILGSMDFTTDVSTGADLLEQLLNGIAALEGNNAQGELSAVFHPNSWAKLRKLIGDAATFAKVGTRTVEGFGGGTQDTQTNNKGYVGSPFGVHCYITTHVPVKAISTVDNYDNKLFTSEAVAAGFIRDIGVDVDDNVPARALDLMAWYTIDTTKLVDDYGVNLVDEV